MLSSSAIDGKGNLLIFVIDDTRDIEGRLAVLDAQGKVREFVDEFWVYRLAGFIEDDGFVLCTRKGLALLTRDNIEIMDAKLRSILEIVPGDREVYMVGKKKFVAVGKNGVRTVPLSYEVRPRFTDGTAFVAWNKIIFNFDRGIALIIDTETGETAIASIGKTKTDKIFSVSKCGGSIVAYKRDADGARIVRYHSLEDFIKGNEDVLIDPAYSGREDDEGVSLAGGTCLDNRKVLLWYHYDLYQDLWPIWMLDTESGHLYRSSLEVYDSARQVWILGRGRIFFLLRRDFDKGIFSITSYYGPF